MSFLESYNPESDIIEQLQQFSPDRNVAFIAIEELTDAPVETRKRFLGQYALWLQVNTDDPSVVENPYSTALTNIGYVAGYYGSPQDVDRILESWQQADITVTHPIFGEKIPDEEIMPDVAKLEAIEAYRVQNT